MAPHRAGRELGGVLLAVGVVAAEMDHRGVLGVGAEREHRLGGRRLVALRDPFGRRALAQEGLEPRVQEVDPGEVVQDALVDAHRGLG